MERADEEETTRTVKRTVTVFGPLDTDSTSIKLGGSQRHAAVLRDVIWTLYSKLAAVLEGHRVVYEVSRWISAVGQTANDTYF